MVSVPAVIPPAMSKEIGSSSRKRSRVDNEGTTENMIKSERDWTQRMNQSYDELQSMLPKLLSKSTKENIVSETIEHIKALQKEVKRLEDQKNSSTSMAAKGNMSMFSNMNSSINITVSGDIVFFGIEAEARQMLVTDIFIIFHKHGAEVLAANVAVNHGQLTLTVTALVTGNQDNITEKIKRDIMNLL